MLPQNCPEMHFCLSVRFLRQHRIFRRIWNQLVKHSKMYFYPTMLFIVYDIWYCWYDKYTGKFNIYRDNILYMISICILNLPVEVFMLGISIGFITSTQVISYIITHHKVFLKSILSSSGSKWGHIYKFKQS